MKDLIDELPGIALPVGEVTHRLNTMWEGDPGGSPSEFRASQMNVVLHLGGIVSAGEAVGRFHDLIQFAQRYPSRIIVLCPGKSKSDGSMQAKLFSQCYIGDSHREMCCCEALILGYETEDSGSLANQVSVWLESDLPTYHWFNRVPAERIEAYFDNLLVGVRRCIYDSSIESEDLSQLDWPEPDRVDDLASARLLPVRQAIGQYLSGYPIEEICRGLESVRIRHAAFMSGEGARLQEWIRSCLSDCGKCDDPASPCYGESVCSALRADYELGECAASDCLLTLEFCYQDERYFSWKMRSGDNLGRIEASLGKSSESLTTRVKPLSPEQTIAEALLF
ncbi:MAG: glucose-6-phosphate dehydrogenase assembly protein OpcA [Opitutales bacterium]